MLVAGSTARHVLLRAIRLRGPPLRSGEDASQEPARELDYPLCLPRTMRISRTPSSTWAVPSATKPCLR